MTEAARRSSRQSHASVEFQAGTDHGVNPAENLVRRGGRGESEALLRRP